MHIIRSPSFDTQWGSMRKPAYVMPPSATRVTIVTITSTAWQRCDGSRCSICENGAVSGVTSLVRPAVENFTDPRNGRIILLAAVGLAMLGAAILAATVMWWRTSKVASPTLAPLEVMGSRKWSKATYSEREQLLDGVRPDDAYALTDQRAKPEPVDLSSLVRTTPEWLDDLQEQGPADAEWLAQQLGPPEGPAVDVVAPQRVDDSASAAVADDIGAHSDELQVSEDAASAPTPPPLPAAALDPILAGAVPPPAPSGPVSLAHPVFHGIDPEQLPSHLAPPEVRAQPQQPSPVATIDPLLDRDDTEPEQER
jgi:hypothetical protein